jgi:DNA-binding protein HU-beta
LPVHAGVGSGGWSGANPHLLRREGDAVNKAELIAQVCQRADVTRTTAENCIEATFDVLAAAMAMGEETNIHGFGVFTTRTRGPRNARNPRTGETIRLGERRYPVFLSCRALKDDMDGYIG